MLPVQWSLLRLVHRAWRARKPPEKNGHLFLPLPVFLAVYLQSHSMDQAKEGLLVVYPHHGYRKKTKVAVNSMCKDYSNGACRFFWSGYCILSVTCPMGSEFFGGKIWQISNYRLKCSKSTLITYWWSNIHLVYSNSSSFIIHSTTLSESQFCAF